MKIINIRKTLIVFLLFAFGAAPKLPAQGQKEMIYGNWISVQPLYDVSMELSFYSTGKYIEVIRSTRSNKIQAKNTGTFKMINDSTIKINSNSRVFYHKIIFTNKNAVRFYSTKNKLKESALLIYAFNFIRNKG